MRKLFAVFLVAALVGSAQAGTTRSLQDVSSISAPSGTALSVPTVGTSLSSDTSTETLQNKSISGSQNTITAVPAATALSGQVPVANGGTGASTLTANGILQGNGTSAVSAVTGTQYQSLQFGASGVPTAGAVQLDQSAAVAGQLPVANGGTGLSSLTSGSVLVGAGSSSPTLVAPGSSGNVLTSNGTTWVSSSAPSTAPTVNGSQASPQSVTAAGGVTLTSPTVINVAFIQSNTGAVTVTATPSISNCSSAGQVLYVIGESATNTVTLQDNAGLAGSNLYLNGNWTSGLNKTLTLTCDGASHWVEVARSG